MEGKNKPKAKYLYLDKFERSQKIQEAINKGFTVRIENVVKNVEINRLTTRDDIVKLKSYFLIQLIITMLLMTVMYYVNNIGL